MKEQRIYMFFLMSDISKNMQMEAPGIIPADELLTKYNIKLISWNYTQSIKNNFPTNKKLEEI
ncbi:hypothetical protein [Brevibacillus sp. SKDU10]|uniref:hypothetical protein n=1 Tax=Brevibacillus sp. SKDU10 TaxID=1247872 RepID=UPI001E3214CD|nr:hypothetical protein [Brevibacillus sp. SKDU10]